jgi:outer membrane protein assembly factor BamB
VFFGCDDGRVYALDASTGELIWSSAPSYHIVGVYSYMTKPIVSSLLAYDGKIVVSSIDGSIYVFDAQTRERIPEEVKVPMETWIFLILPLLFIVLITAAYLYRGRRR